MEGFKAHRDGWEKKGVAFNNKNRPTYFAYPVQVKFLDTGCKDPTWIGAIAFRDYIICGCCGAMIPLREFWEDIEYRSQNDPAGVNITDEEALILYNDWVDINKEISEE